MRLASIGYIPPATFTGARSFYENVRRFKTKHDLLLFSEADWPEVNIKLKMSPEQPFMSKVGGKPALVKPHKFAINNVLWFTAMRMAREAGYSHVCYLESDCRVGCHDWDAKMFDEYFGLGRALICGGTCAVYNPANWNRKATDRWCELVAQNFIKRNMPVATYGWKGAGDRHPSCVFPNGALSIVSLEWIHELFDLTQPSVKLALNPEPYDMALGTRIWGRFEGEKYVPKFEEDAYEVVGHLNSIYSGYGDVVTSLAERKEMLTSGRYNAIHHVKEEWQPK